MLYENITITTEDNLHLEGWFIHNGALTMTKPTIIYMHETYGNIGYRLSWAENIYQNLGVNIVLVGYRGYGRSEGKPTEKGLQLDSKAIIEWTLNNPKILSTQVYVLGNVLGGAVGLYGSLLYQDQLKGLILQNTFSSMSNAIEDACWMFRFLSPLILKNYWPNEERIANLGIPVLFISGTDTVTNDDMHKLQDLAVNSMYTDFLEVKGGNKKNTWRVGGASYLNAIDDFILKTRGMIYVPIETEEIVISGNATISR